MKDILEKREVGKTIFTYFFPLALGFLLQQAYSLVDGLILGRMVGSDGLASIGGTNSTLINLVITFFAGLSSGPMVLSSQAFGAKKKEEVQKIINTAFFSSIILGIFLFIVVELLSEKIHIIMKTPLSSFEYSITYIKWYFLGIIPTLIFNMGTNILRSLGENKKPLYYLIFSITLNFFLDILFVFIFSNKVMAVALASALSQLISSLFVIRTLYTLKDGMNLSFKGKLIYSDKLISSIKIGIPAALQNAMYFVTSILISYVINLLGAKSVAAWSIFFRFDGIYWALSSSFSLSLANVSGLFYGEKNIKKVKYSGSIGVFCYLLVAIPFCLILFLLRNILPSLFVHEVEVAKEAGTIIGYIALTYPVFAYTEIYSSVMRGTGETLKPTILTFISICVLRVLFIALVCLRYPSDLTVSLCYSITWAFSSLFFIIYYHKGGWLKKNDA